VSNASLVIKNGSGTRRSTRVRQAIQLAVQGVDSFRGPYRENVSTVIVNCHGCMYESKFDVSPNAFVILGLNGEAEHSAPISRRGRVKWRQRPADRGGLGLTAIEFDEPGNFWGIDSQPSDWLPFSSPRSSDSNGSNPKMLTVLRPEAAAATIKVARAQQTSRQLDESASQPFSVTRPANDSIGGLQQQLERMLSEAAEVAVREKAKELLNELREEAKRVIVATTSSHAGSRIDELLKRMNQIGEESARARHSRWTEKIEANLQLALTRLELRNRELEEASEVLTTKVQTQLQRFLEASRTDTVDRIVARLKEQSAPVIGHARKVIAELTTREVEMERICQQYVEKSAAQIEESYTRIDKKFEGILRERLNSACNELELAANAAAKLALNCVRASAQQREAEGQVHLQGALGPVTERALANLKEQAANISREFAKEMCNYSRSHLESVSTAIIELGKGIERLSKIQSVPKDKPATT
jgi:hypothetical protein